MLPRTRHFLGEALLQGPVVRQPGDRIGRRLLPRQLIQAGVFQRHRRLVGERADDIGVVRLELMRSQQEEIAGPAPPEQDRRAQQCRRRERPATHPQRFRVAHQLVVRDRRAVRRPEPIREAALEDQLREICCRRCHVGVATARLDTRQYGVAQIEDRDIGPRQRPAVHDDPRRHRVRVEARGQRRAGRVQRARPIELAREGQLGRAGTVAQMAREDGGQRDEADLEEELPIRVVRRRACPHADKPVAERDHDARTERDPAPEADRGVDDEREVRQEEGRGLTAGRGDECRGHDDIEQSVGVGGEKPRGSPDPGQAAEQQVVKRRPPPDRGTARGGGFSGPRRARAPRTTRHRSSGSG